jgi:hypothetical protein
MSHTLIKIIGIIVLGGLLISCTLEGGIHPYRYPGEYKDQAIEEAGTSP